MDIQMTVTLCMAGVSQVQIGTSLTGAQPDPLLLQEVHCLM